MHLKQENPFGATSKEAIAQFEARRQIVLPEEYREFLLRSNGGRPVPDGFEVSGWPHHSSCVHGFLGIHAGTDWQLERACDVYAERIPCELLPIASDDFGNAVCLGIMAPRRGKIYFWDHEDELDQNGLSRQDYGNVYFLANSLDEFLNKLHEHTEE